MNRVLPELLKLKRYDLVAHLSLEAVLAVPGELNRLEYFQTARVKALAALGKTSEALSAAKSLYNVSGMGYMRQALLVVADAVAASNRNDAALYQQFAREQADGAMMPTGEAATSPTTRGSSPKPPLLLSNVKVDGAPYQRAFDREAGSDFGSLTATGNLFLLCDRAEDARRMFERAYMIAPEDRLAYATENLARAMKARDGTVGRANAFVLSVRPKEDQR